MGFAFVESNLLFQFGDRWTKVLKWDRERAHTEGMNNVHQGKDVDFVGLLEGKVLFFIEVKNYREHSRSPEKGDLGQEFELKVRSTVAALVGAHRCGYYPDCSALFDVLADPLRAVRLVHWVEELDESLMSKSRESAMSKSTADKRGKAFSVTTPRRRKQDVCWLDVETTELNSNNDYSNDMDLQVTPLSIERKTKIENVMNTLRATGAWLADDARWRIEDTYDMALIDEWLERASSVSSAYQLLRRS